MGILLVLLAVAIHQGEGMVVKHYGKKHVVGALFFNAMVCLFSTVFFILTDKGGLCFPKEMFAYGIVSCLSFAMGFYSSYVAFKIGSFAGTMLMVSFSGVISIFYGIVFLKEPASVITYVAIILVFLSVFLMRYKANAQEESKGFSVKWFLWALLSAISNGFIGVVSRMQQIRFDSAFDNEFLIFSAGGSFLILFVISMVKERENFGYVLKNGLFWGMSAGLLNGCTNLVMLMTYLFIPISVVTPIRTGMGLIASFLISVLIYRERFSISQLISVAIGIVALVLFQL